VVHIYQGQYQPALEALDAALAIQREIGDATGEAVTLSNIGYVQRSLGRLQLALDAYRQAIAIGERVAAAVAVEEFRASLAAEREAIYAAAAEILLELGQPAEAFAVAEAGRGRAFLDQLARGHLDLRQGADAELLTQEAALAAELARLDRSLRQERARPSAQRSVEQARTLADQLSRRRREYDELLVRLKLSRPDYAGLVSATPLTLPEAQRLLTPDMTLVVYYLTGERAFAFVIGREQFASVTLPATPAQLRAAVAASRQSLLAQDAIPPQGLADLYAWLIAPLRSRLTTPLVGIVPHDALHYLPFAALPIPRAPLFLKGGGGGHSQRYLGQERILFTLPSVSALPHIQARTAVEMSSASVTRLVVAFGRPEGLPALHHVDQEARTVAGFYGQEPLVGATATESAFRERAIGAQVIHVAAHGQLNTANPLFSRLLLAPDSAHDGALEVREVYGLDLRGADLATLSACQTQLGAHSGGDEIVGLSRAFLYAGAATVAASLWSVDDEATAAFMQAFYAGLRDGLGKAEALRAAQAAVRGDKAHPEWAHPYYWAAFTVTGDPGAVKIRPSRSWPAWAIALPIGAALAALGVAAWRLRAAATDRQKEETRPTSGS